jgi:chromosome segregation ATPase
MRRKIVIAALALVMLAGLSQASALHAQERRSAESSKEDDKQVLRTLLDEVRQLRLALQRSNALNHRVQITLERLRLQQGRVDSLTRSLENLRTRISDLKNARPQMEEQIKHAEEVMSRATEQNRREEIEHQLKEMKTRLASWSREEEQLREREASLSSELQIEQNKLNELHGQLENMLRQLDGP